MNIYARYFDQEILVYSVDELIDFLASIPEIRVTQELINDITDYVEGEMPYPKRYKIRPRVYFILIKTTAESMEEFKANKKQNGTSASAENESYSKKDAKAELLQTAQFGWYKGELTFKRVMLIPGTPKYQYQDTFFSAYVKGNNGMDCYNRMIEYLKQRPDVDLRSQFPSAKGANFHFEYIGELLPGRD